MPTDPSPVRPGADQRRALTVQARDAGMRVARQITGWTVAGAVALGGAFTALTAHAYHARAATTPPRRAVSQADDSGTASSATASGSTAPQPPASAPLPAAPAPAAPVVSGGS